jgi:hypothetical protein
MTPVWQKKQKKGHEVLSDKFGRKIILNHPERKCRLRGMSYINIFNLICYMRLITIVSWVPKGTFGLAYKVVKRKNVREASAGDEEEIKNS